MYECRNSRVNINLKEVFEKTGILFIYPFVEHEK